MLCSRRCAACIGTAVAAAHYRTMTQISSDRRAAEAELEGQVALVKMSLGKAKVKIRVRVTPQGLLAIGGLVSSILLSTAVLVWVSTTVVRRHPIAGRLSLP